MALETLNEIYQVEKEEAEKLSDYKIKVNKLFNDEINKISKEHSEKLNELQKKLNFEKNAEIDKYLMDNISILNDSKNKANSIDDLFNEKKEELVKKILDFIMRGK